VSEQPTASAGGGGKLFGMPRNVVIIGGVVFLAALGYLWWKRGQAQAAATTASATTAASTQQQPTDYAGQLSVIQTELEALLANQGQTGTTTTGTTTGTGTTATGSTPVVESIPDGNGGWEQVNFPSQAAWQQFLAWSAPNGTWGPAGTLAQDQAAGRTRADWNNYLTSIGATPVSGQWTTNPNQ
jgi:hypothetical protein